MFAWRLSVCLLLAGLFATPLLLPIVEVLWRGQAGQVWCADGSRILYLLRNTLLLAGGTLALVLPLGIAGAVLLFRTDLPLRTALRTLTVLSLFVPVPLLVSAWQAAFGTSGWLGLWEDRPGQPWTSGLGPAIWINSLAALPWMILLIGQGLCWVEAELEEEALLVVGPWRVLWHVTLPRCRAVIGAAALWVGLQTAAEITITDMLEVRTFAEEIYSQFALGAEQRALAVSLPATGLLWLALVWLVPRLDRRLPPLQTMASPPRSFRLGKTRWLFSALSVLAVLILAGVPLGSLIWKAGLHGLPLEWSASFALESFWLRFQLFGGKLAINLLMALAAGVAVSTLALVACWAAGGSRLLSFGMLSLCALAWAIPGPIAGIGLKDLIAQLVRWFPAGPMAEALYYSPSPLPAAWAHALRFFPWAAALLWPAVRMIPQELREAVRLDGARPGQELVWIIAPLSRRAFCWAALAVTALSLSEIGASKRVEPPGGLAETFTHLLFDRMHNGVDHEVAGLCLVLLAEVVAVLMAGAALAGGWRRFTGRTQPGR